MDSIAYEKMSTALKVSAKVVGVILIAYGCVVGVLGIGPDGATVAIGWRLIGLFVLLQGSLYFISNLRIMGNPRLLILYLVATLLPAVIMICASLLSVITSGLSSFARDGGLMTVVVLVPISILAPLSLVFCVLGTRRSVTGDDDRS